MIKIEIDKNWLDVIIKRYSEFIIKRIKRPEIDNPVYNHFKDNLSQIISSPYAEMKGIIDDFEKKFKEQEEISKFYLYIKDEYERLFQLKIEPGISLGSWLGQKLDIRVCPYCNRQYTFTVIKEKGEKKALVRNSTIFTQNPNTPIWHCHSTTSYLPVPHATTQKQKMRLNSTLTIRDSRTNVDSRSII